MLSSLVAIWLIGYEPLARFPLFYGGFPGVEYGDAPSIYALARGLQSPSKFFQNPQLGFPAEQDLGLFPFQPLLVVIFLWVAGLLGLSAFAAVNSYFILSFFFVSFTAYWVLHRLGVHRFLAFALSISVSLIPWHFWRFHHLDLTNYIAPFLFVLLLTFLLGPPSAPVANPRIGRRETWPPLGLGVLIGATSTYYSLFATLLSLSTVIPVLLARRARSATVIWGACLSSIPALVALSWTVFWRMQAKTAQSAGEIYVRTAEESQAYGGALFTLFRVKQGATRDLLPGGLANVSVVNDQFEADAGLGIVTVAAVLMAVLGLFILLASIGSHDPNRWPTKLGYLWLTFVISLLFFVSGGFGQILTLFASSQIRSWGRLSVFVVALAVVIFALMTKYWSERSSGVVKVLVYSVLPGLLLAATLFEAVTAPRTFNANDIKRRGSEINNVVKVLNESRPIGCGVLQLPYRPYPEGGAYTELLPYAAGSTSAWSFGAIHGTSEAESVSDYLSASWTRSIQELKASGACALLIDMNEPSGPDLAERANKKFGQPDLLLPSMGWNLWLF